MMVWVRASVIAVILIKLYGVESVATINDTEVVLVHALFRHGERTTEHFYPTDPHKNETFYPFGLGGLTNKGKLMQYKLGEALRENYDKLLGKVYSEDKIEARSTDTTRTRMSALLVLAGLWPPSEEQKWHPSLMWQPIPVNYKSLKEEDLLQWICCEFRKVVIENLPKDPQVYSTYIEPHKSMFEYIEKHSGMSMNNLLDLLNFYLTVATESDFGLQLPEWTRAIYPEPLQETAALVYGYLNHNPEVKKIQAGYLLQKMINDSVAKINNELVPVDRKMFLYAGHDTTLGYLLNALKVLKPMVPPYGSTIILELHRRAQDYLFKLSFLEDPLNPKIQDLTVPGCDTLCPVNKFIQLHNEFLPIISMMEACDIRNTN